MFQLMCILCNYLLYPIRAIHSYYGGSSLVTVAITSLLQCRPEYGYFRCNLQEFGNPVNYLAPVKPEAASPSAKICLLLDLDIQTIKLLNNCDLSRLLFPLRKFDCAGISLLLKTRFFFFLWDSFSQKYVCCSILHLVHAC